MAMVQCKECGKDVSSSAAQCPHCGKKLKMGMGKKVLIGVVGFFVFALIIGNLVGGDDQAQAPGNQDQLAQAGSQADDGRQGQAAAPAEKNWTIVSQLSGTGDKKGPVFTLTGAEARVRYSVKGEMAMLAVYVLEAGTDLMQTGGMPEVMETAAGSGESSIHGKRGEYYLNVSGMGNWQVWLEELR